jgi:hypothetical protein
MAQVFTNSFLYWGAVTMNTFYAIMHSLKSGAPVMLTGAYWDLDQPAETYKGALMGVVHRIEREDGSGKSWNLVMYSEASKKYYGMYLRTVD